MTRPYRNLICPICGAVLSVAIKDESTGDIPGEHLLPRHEPAKLGRGNLCAMYRVRIVVERATCDKCGRPMMDHPSGLCLACHFASGVDTAPALLTDGDHE